MTFAEGMGIEDPASAGYEVAGHRLVQRRADHLVLVELARRLVVRLVGSQIVVPEHESLAAANINIHTYLQKRLSTFAK